MSGEQLSFKRTEIGSGQSLYLSNTSRKGLELRFSFFSISVPPRNIHLNSLLSLQVFVHHFLFSNLGKAGWLESLHIPGCEHTIQIYVISRQIILWTVNIEPWSFICCKFKATASHHSISVAWGYLILIWKTICFFTYTILNIAAPSVHLKQMEQPEDLAFDAYLTESLILALIQPLNS